MACWRRPISCRETQGAKGSGLAKFVALAQKTIAKIGVLWVKFLVWNFQTVV
jgi:hypothetical protein